MAKARMYGTRKPYVKNGMGDRILIRNKMCFARGGDKPRQSEKLFLEHLSRVRKDWESLESPYTVVALPRNGGKMAYMIQKALQEGGAIAVSREETKRAILQTAAIMGVDTPEVVVLKKERNLEKSVTLSGVLIDIYEERSRYG